MGNSPGESSWLPAPVGESGRRFSRRLVGEGATVIGVYHTAAAEAGELEREFPGALKMLQADLADLASISTLAALLQGEGELHGLVNNAGTIDFQEWDGFSAREWRRVFAVNVDAPVFLTMRFVDCFRAMPA